MIYSTIPYKTEAEMPNTSTGPATVNSFAPRPVTKPSLLNSSAGETIEFANPVIGTSVPAPAYFAMLSYTPQAFSYDHPFCLTGFIVRIEVKDIPHF